MQARRPQATRLHDVDLLPRSALCLRRRVRDTRGAASATSGIGSVASNVGGATWRRFALLLVHHNKMRLRAGLAKVLLHLIDHGLHKRRRLLPRAKHVHAWRQGRRAGRAGGRPALLRLLAYPGTHAGSRLSDFLCCQPGRAGPRRHWKGRLLQHRCHGVGG